jgi:putative membrane protein
MTHRHAAKLPGITYPLILLGILGLVVVWSGINPHQRFDWIVDNSLGLALIALVVFSGRYFRLSHLSYTAMFIFMVAHIVGTHWTYQETPFGYTLAQWFGETRRNHYDRLIHFLFGLCFAYPVREVCLRIADMRGFWGLYIPFDVTMAMSALFEILEMALAITIGGDQGTDYIGSQGDVWDAQKDMFLAGVGALLTITATGVINAIYNPDWRQEWRASFRIKSDEPLGEVRLGELIDEHDTSKGKKSQ